MDSENGLSKDEFKMPEYFYYGDTKISTKGLIGMTYYGEKGYDYVVLKFENRKDRTFRIRQGQPNGISDWTEVKNGNICNE